MSNAENVETNEDKLQAEWSARIAFKNTKESMIADYSEAVLTNNHQWETSCICKIRHILGEVALGEIRKSIAVKH
jgi:hypothetical protein